MIKNIPILGILGKTKLPMFYESDYGSSKFILKFLNSDSNIFLVILILSSKSHSIYKLSYMI